MKDARDEGDPEDDEPTVVEGDVMDVRLGRPDSQPEPELNAPANSDATSRSARSETHAEPEAEVSTSASTDMEIVADGRRVRFREERADSRDTIWTHPRTGSRWWNCVEKRQDEPRPVDPLFLFILRSKLSQVSAAAASDWRATPREHDRGRTFGRLQNDDATRPTRTMDADQRRKNDEHPEGKGGETKLLRRGKQGTRNLFDCVGRGET